MNQPDTNTITFNAGSTNVGVLIFGPYTNQLSTDGSNPTWNGVPIGVGGQTPWLSDINAALFSLTNLLELSVGTNGVNPTTIDPGQVSVVGSAANSISISSTTGGDQLALTTAGSSIQIAIDPGTQAPSVFLSMIGGPQLQLGPGFDTNATPFFLQTLPRPIGSLPLMQIDNDTNLTFAIGYDGTIYGGSESVGFLSPADEFAALQIYHDANIGETTKPGIGLYFDGIGYTNHAFASGGVTTSGGLNYGYWGAESDGPPLSGLDSITMNDSTDAAIPNFRYVRDATTRFQFAPNIATSATNGAAYYFDTTGAITTNEVRLATFRNNGVVKADIRSDGTSTWAETTVAPTVPAAGFATLFLKDTGGGKMRLSIQFPSGAAQTIATEP